MARVLLASVALAFVACITARDAQINRREASAPVIGCPPADTIVPLTEEHAWTAQCRGRDTVYDCHGELHSAGLAYSTICEPRQ